MRLSVRYLPLLFGILGIASALVKLLPIPSNTITYTAVEYGSFALAMSFGIAIAWQTGRAGRPSASRTFVASFGSTLTLLSFQTMVLGPGSLRSPLIGFAAAVVDASTAMLGTSIAIPKLRTLRFLSLTIAGAIAASISPAVARAYGLPLDFYFFAPEAILGTCFGFALLQFVRASVPATQAERLLESEPDAVNPSTPNWELRRIAETRLDSFEQSVERAAFLATISSAFLLMIFAGLAAASMALVIIILAAVLVPIAGAGLLSGVIVAMACLAALSLVLFLWGVIVGRARATATLVYTLICAAVITLLGSRMVVNFILLEGCDWMGGGPFWCYASAETIDALRRLQPTVVLLLLIPVSFGLRIMWDGWHFARTPHEIRKLAAAVPGGRARLGLVGAFGIHPICRWLPGLWRRLATGGLFVLASLVLGGTIAFAMGVVYFAPHLPLFAIVECLGGVASPFAQNCWSLEESVALWMLGYLGAGVALLIILRSSARRLARVSLEEATPLGPVVAIGVPGSSPPFGAARAYADDSEWRASVARLAETAGAIVIVVDDTHGVQWELAHIRRAGHVTKTLFLLPPRLAAANEAIRILRRDLAESSAATEAAATMLVQGQGACVGWHRDSSGALSFFTTGHLSSLSYICAIRLVFERPHEVIEKLRSSKTR